ncbi:MAG: hypothetical protein ACSHYF_16340 [Verrucomicrobiaceae bacterium]
MNPTLLITALTSSGLSAAVVYQTTFLSPLPGGSSLHCGKFFMEVTDTTARYQIWSGEIGGTSFSIQSPAHEPHTQLLGTANLITLHGCDLDPQNPYLPLSINLPLNGYQCDALKTYRVYEGEITNTKLLQDLQTGSNFTIGITLNSSWSSAPASGLLTQIPEPSSASLLILISLTALKRHRCYGDRPFK